ncbi:hypothetical protein VSDG_05811 [Cytospora chrysosperma]|uniref:F-box domain-containing protein n=1 Tax=Cytospora chrysosperma TaxID=252740 RepID=A0A423VVN6_CYTCH|nr:hypothetical protein VSDG_05811 [Valsa sordida]
MALALSPAANTAPNGLAVDCRPASYKASAEVPEPSSSPKLMNARSSFSSIREDDTHLAQAFTASKVSRYSKPQTDQPAHDDRLPSDMGTMVQHAEFFPPVTQPTSRLHGNWFPAENFKGWKQINVRGRLASRSFSDLASLSLAWDTRPVPVRRPSKVTGDSPIERLPLELLSSIINLLLLDVPPNGITKRNMDLMSLLLTSKKIHGATLLTLYRQITIPHSKIFQKFLAHVSCHQPLGTLVRRFDFCHFNPSTLFETASERSQARNLTSDTLLQALDLTPHLQEFLAQEHIDDDLDERVLRKLLFGFERIQALDFCGCSAASFRDAFTSTILSADWSPPAAALRIRRLSLHRCNTLAPAVLEALLAHLPDVTHLDLAGTRLTDAALAAIPPSARISHLNLAKCNNLSAGAIARFVSAHPAAAGGSLVWLSLATDARTHEIFDADAVRTLLPLLPASLKSLSLKGSRMDRSHIPLLRPLTKHLEELALGRGLGVNDTNGLFVPDEPAQQQQQQQQQEEEEEHGGEGSSLSDGDTASTSSHSSRQQQALDEWVPHTLRYLDLSDMWHGELDLPTLYNTAGCALLTSTTAPLEVVEVSEDVARRLAKGHAPLTRLGWRVSELGSRTWIVRVAGSGGGSGGTAARDTGARWWKMGAENWGMRKVPVARAEVGGMYGSYMFARKL